MNILHSFLDPRKGSPAKQPSIRRIPPTFEQFKNDHPVSARMALERNAIAHESYLREQRTRPRTFRPVRYGHAVVADRRAA